jgi:transposase
MEKKSRRKFSVEFKTKVVLEALKERHTTEELAKKFSLHPNQITTWKKEFLDNAHSAFGSDGGKEMLREKDEMIDKLYAQIGQREVEIDFLKKKLQ